MPGGVGGVWSLLTSPYPDFGAGEDGALYVTRLKDLRPAFGHVHRRNADRVRGVAESRASWDELGDD
jgi:hypothetical protein